MKPCIIEDCPNRADVVGAARGYCKAHYKRFMKYGDAKLPPARTYTWKGEICSEAGCGKLVTNNGLCGHHHGQMKKLQKELTDPEGQKRKRKEAKERWQKKKEILMGRAKPDLCEICSGVGYGRGKEREAVICFDHCHITGKPRGWICNRCNKVLGLLKDDVFLINQLLQYLEKHNVRLNNENKKTNTN